VFHVIKTVRKVAAAGALTLAFAVWAPFNAFACGTADPGGGIASGGVSAAGGGNGIATGGSQVGALGSTTIDGATFAALSAFVIMVALAVLAISLAITLRRPRPNLALMAQLSADGRYWWDGTAWNDGLQNPLPPSVRSADGFYWWDGGSWRAVPTS
jgi:hypothetical protein